MVYSLWELHSLRKQSVSSASPPTPSFLPPPKKVSKSLVTHSLAHIGQYTGQESTNGLWIGDSAFDEEFPVWKMLSKSGWEKSLSLEISVAKSPRPWAWSIFALHLVRKDRDLGKEKGVFFGEAGSVMLGVLENRPWKMRRGKESAERKACIWYCPLPDSLSYSLVVWVYLLTQKLWMDCRNRDAHTSS